MEIWRPRCAPPTGLWRPVGIDATAISGPTRRSAQRSKWRRTSWGQYVPSHVEESVEQRILEAWAGVPSGQVTGWAALRLYGGGFFEGLESDGLTAREVPILVAHDHRPSGRSGVSLIRCVNMPSPHWQHGIAVSSPARSVFEAMRFARSERHAVTEVDMVGGSRDHHNRRGRGRVSSHSQGQGDRSRTTSAGPCGRTQPLTDGDLAAIDLVIGREPPSSDDESTCAGSLWPADRRTGSIRSRGRSGR